VCVCVCVCVCACVCVCVTHTHAHTRMQTYTHTHTHTYVCPYTRGANTSLIVLSSLSLLPSLSAPLTPYTKYMKYTAFSRTSHSCRGRRSNTRVTQLAYCTTYFSPPHPTKEMYKIRCIFSHLAQLPRATEQQESDTVRILYERLVAVVRSCGGEGETEHARVEREEGRG